MEQYLFKNAKVLDPATGMNEMADIFVEDENIEAVDQNLEPTPETKVIDLEGKLVMPGAVDLHVHLRAMKQKHKETIESGTKAARKGGVTTLLAMPNTDPTLDDVKSIQEYQKLVEHAKVTVYLAGSITQKLKGKHLAEIEKYPELGIKFITDDGMDVNDEELFKTAMEGAKELGLTVMVHPEVSSIAPKGVMNEGEISKELDVPGQPNEKEWKAVERALKLQRETGARVHLTHLTTAESVQLVREAKKSTDQVTCDVTPHHIALTQQVVRSHLGMAKVNPPLRTEADRRALILGIKDGTIDAIATDHAPHALKEKMQKLEKAAFGFSGLEVFLPAVFHQLHHIEGLELMEIVKLITTNPADILGVTGVTLKEGTRADMVIVDLDLEKEVDGQQFVSMGKVTAFDGMKLKGWPVMTVYGGKVFEV